MAKIVTDNDHFIHKVLCIAPLKKEILKISDPKTIGEEEVLNIARDLIPKLIREHGELKNFAERQQAKNDNFEKYVEWCQIKSLKGFVKKFGQEETACDK